MQDQGGWEPRVGTRLQVVTGAGKPGFVQQAAKSGQAEQAGAGKSQARHQTGTGIRPGRGQQHVHAQRHHAGIEGALVMNGHAPVARPQFIIE